MKLPFSPEQFLKVFELYNEAIWPIQVLFYLLAMMAVFAAFRRFDFSDKVISSILAFFWIWMGAVYHIIFFSAINKAALLFGAAFILQGLIFFYYTFVNKKLSYRYSSRSWGIVGSGLIIFSLLIYPVLGYLQGHIYPASPTFGLPCPTTIFTLGVLLWTNKKIPIGLILIPTIWVFIGFSAAFSLGIKEDISLLVSGILFIIVLVVRKKYFIVAGSL